jgi:hypothetical protein
MFSLVNYTFTTAHVKRRTGKEFGMKRSCPILTYYSIAFWRDGGKPRESSRSPDEEPNTILLQGKGKVVLVLFLTEHHAMKAYWESGGIATRILDLCPRWT